MTKLTHQLLVRAREIIEDPARWTTGTYARDERGQSILATDPSATCFCAYGALYRAIATAEGGVSSGDQESVFHALQLQAQLHSSLHTVAATNDHLGHEAVLGLFDHAIKATAWPDPSRPLPLTEATTAMLKIYLTRARALITDPKHWTAGSFARDRYGNPSTSADGECWCARGAIRKVGGFEHERQLTDILNLSAVQALNERRGIIYVNDRLGHEAVLKVFDHAIANVQG